MKETNPVVQFSPWGLAKDINRQDVCLYPGAHPSEHFSGWFPSR